MENTQLGTTGENYDKESKISIIMPVYNKEKYIEISLNSVLKQTYKNLQIILVDDGSTDKSGEICEEYALKDNRIEVFHKENGGVATALNLGLQKVKGDYISFIDSDDYVCPTFCEELYDLLLENDADISECEFFRISARDSEKSQEILDAENSKYNKSEDVCDNMKALRLLYGPCGQAYVKKDIKCNKLYKKEIFADIEFQEGKLYEDDNTIYKILNKAKKLVSTNRRLYGYIQSENSRMRRDITRKMIDDTLYAFSHAASFFEQRKETEIEAKARRKYLEYCIELAYKVKISRNAEKVQLLEEIKQNYINYCDKYMSLIKEENPTLEEQKVIQLLEEIYNDVSKNGELSTYWKTLKDLINKD